MAWKIIVETTGFTFEKGESEMQLRKGKRGQRSVVSGRVLRTARGVGTGF